MRFSKCPRCELNYIFSNERYCKVCMASAKGNGAQEEVEMCSNCNENPVMPGRDVCEECFKEMEAQNLVDNGGAADEGNEHVDPRSLTGMEDVSSMNEIPEINNDLPAGEIDMSSLESMREEEEEEDDDEDEDDL